MAARVGQALQALKSSSRKCIEVACILALSPYFRVYDRNTRQPMTRIVRSATEQEASSNLKLFFERKRKEAQYVQVAGAIMFTSVTSCLSWNSLQKVHWTAPAFWYASILLSISAVVSGAQQVMIIPDEPPEPNALAVKERLTHQNDPEETTSNRFMLFAWQTPLMLLSYSMVMFLAGLGSAVLSPLAANPVWGGEAKTAILFLLVMLVSCLSFLLSSLGIYQTFQVY